MVAGAGRPILGGIESGGRAMRYWLCVPLLLLSSAWAAGQDAPVEPERPKPREDVRTLLDAAAGLEPEFRADLTLRVLEWHRELHPDSGAELAEELYQQADGLVAAPIGSISPLSDTLPNLAERAARLGLDALSVRRRALAYLLAHDRVELALELNELTRKPAPADAECADVTVYRLQPYYESLQALVVAGLAAGALDPDDAVALVESRAGPPYLQVELPTLFELTSELWTRSDFESAHRERLFALAVSALAETRGGDRQFGFLLGRLGFSRSLGRFLEAAREEGLPVATAVTAGWDYVTEQATGSRCEDWVASERARNGLAEVIELLSEESARLAAEGRRTDPVEALAALEPEESLPAAQVYKLWDAADAREMLAGVRALRFLDGGHERIGSEARGGPEWFASAQDFLLRVDEWQPAPETPPLATFHRKRILYHALIDLSRDDVLTRAVLRSYVAFLAANPVRGSHPDEYLSALDELFDFARSFSDEEEASLEKLRARGAQGLEFNTEVADLVQEELARSSSAVIAAYLLADRAVPAPRNWRR